MFHSPNQSVGSANCAACPRLLWKSAALLAAATALLARPLAHATTPVDADTLTNAYNTAFYKVSGSNGYYANDTTGGNPGFWTGAEEIEMLEDAYDRSNSSTYKSMITALINDFVAVNGSLWTGNSFNDDILWATIACERAYQITGNSTFKSLAKNNFDAVYARAYDTTLGGGLWWNTSKTCTEPRATTVRRFCPACFLYTIENDEALI